MANLEVGQQVRVRCDIQPGPFRTEHLVTFATAKGPVSGFVQSQEVVEQDESGGFVRAIVRDVSEDTITVWVRGSFFTTNGLAYLSPDWARSNVQPLAA